jgi:hypothetical protein
MSFTIFAGRKKECWGSGVGTVFAPVNPIIREGGYNKTIDVIIFQQLPGIPMSTPCIMRARR